MGDQLVGPDRPEPGKRQHDQDDVGASNHSCVVHAVLLDNMRPEQIRNGAARIAKHPAPLVLEVSGGVTEASVRPLAEAGAQIISIGALTHSVTCLDFGLDL